MLARLKRLICRIIGHSPYIRDVKLEWGFPQDVPTYCTRCDQIMFLKHMDGKYKLFQQS